MVMVIQYTFKIMGRTKSIYQEEICSDCLQMLVNGESNHTPEELKLFNKTLNLWKNDVDPYVPAGPVMEDGEVEFSNSKCILCDCLPGKRHLYHFIHTHDAPMRYRHAKAMMFMIVVFLVLMLLVNLMEGTL